MRRAAKIGLAGITAATITAFVLLAPIVPMRVPLPVLYNQHGWCVATYVDPPRMLQIYASVSYALSENGVVYVTSGGYLWWLPQPGTSTSLVCL